MIDFPALKWLWMTMEWELYISTSTDDLRPLAGLIYSETLKKKLIFDSHSGRMWWLLYDWGYLCQMVCVNVTMMSHQFLCPRNVSIFSRMSVLKSDLMCMKIIWTIMCKDCPDTKSQTFEWCLSLYTIKKQWRHLTTTTEFTFNLWL